MYDVRNAYCSHQPVGAGLRKVCSAYFRVKCDSGASVISWRRGKGLSFPGVAAVWHGRPDRHARRSSSSRRCTTASGFRRGVTGRFCRAGRHGVVELGVAGCCCRHPRIACRLSAWADARNTATLLALATCQKVTRFPGALLCSGAVSSVPAYAIFFHGGGSSLSLLEAADRRQGDGWRRRGRPPFWLGPTFGRRGGARSGGGWESRTPRGFLFQPKLPFFLGHGVTAKSQV